MTDSIKYIAVRFPAGSCENVCLQISEWLISRCLDGGESTTDPDLLIRTSGEKRLSDFLMYQVGLKLQLERLKGWK